MSKNKTGKTTIDPTHYISQISNETRRKDAEVLVPMFERITGEKPAMWGPGIIGFGQYRQKYASGREADWPAAGFSPRKSEIVVYLVGKIEKQDEILANLGKHRIGKACLYIRKLEDINMDVLEELITLSTKAILETKK